MVSIKGLDISRHQRVADLNWEAMVDENVKFLIARASIGTLPDDRYARHIRRAEEVGLLTGAYHYLWPGVRARDAVDVYLDAVGNPAGKLLALDVEEGGLTTEMVDDWIAAFRRRLPEHALFLYINPSDYRHLGRARWAKETYLWLAYWPEGGYPGDDSSVWTKDLGGWSGPTIWQYGSNRVDDDKLDGNRFRGTLDELRVYAGDIVKSFPIPDGPHEVSIPSGVRLFANSALTTPAVTLDAAAVLPYIGKYSDTVAIVGYERKALFVRSGKIGAPVPAADDTPYGEAEVDAREAAAAADVAGAAATAAAKYGA